jgi:ATP-grasp domain/L-amino acid ligase C-terminal domain 2/ATP-grasp N-terminal domain
MKRLLLLSTTTGYQLRSFGDAAGDLGVELIFATDRCHTLDDPWRDGAVAVRFHEEEESLAAIVAAGRERPIDGILAVGDRPVVLAARAAEALKLAGNPPDAARASAHKRLARERFATAGLRVPAFMAATTGDDVPRIAASLTYPVVIKPVGLSGSRGVIRANDARQLTAAFHRISALLSRPDIRAQRTGSEQDLLIEEFIDGREYAIEGLLTAGTFRALAIFDKPDPLDGPFFEETIYVTPSRAAGDVQARLVETVQRAASAVGLTHGPVHAECRVNDRGVFMLEIAARPIGGLCSRVLRFEKRWLPPFFAKNGASHRLPLEHLLLAHAVGHDVAGFEREDAAAAVMMIPIPRKGVLKGVRGEEAARQVRHVEDVIITAKPDQRLEPLPEAGSYLGFIFARAPIAADAEAAVRDAHGRLAFVVDPAIDLRATSPV